jgi:phospholipid/cholesterol/gamma-HCH transport system substrate-binding protein
MGFLTLLVLARVTLRSGAVKKLRLTLASSHRPFAESALAVQLADGEAQQSTHRSPSQPDSGIMARASSLMIGTSALVVTVVAFVGFLGFRKIHSIQQRSPLRIVFEGSASGLVKGGNVNFDGVQVGEVTSLKLESPRKIVALTMVENSAPIRKDTVVGLEFQGLTGVAAISMKGGAAAAPPVPLDEDGVPTLKADLTEIQTIRDTLHNVDHMLVNNQSTIKDALLNFETYTASLASQGDAIESALRAADSAIDSFDSTLAKVDNVIPGLANGKNGELFQKVKSLRELAESFNKRSAVFMEEGRRTLLDISESARKVTRKFDGQASDAPGPGPRVRPRPQ